MRTLRKAIHREWWEGHNGGRESIWRLRTWIFYAIMVSTNIIMFLATITYLEGYLSTLNWVYTWDFLTILIGYLYIAWLVIHLLFTIRLYKHGIDRLLTTMEQEGGDGG